MLNAKSKLLYATSARLGGSGLDAVALESVRVAGRAGMLGRVLAFANRQGEIPAARIGALRWHPVRLLSGLGSEFTTGRKSTRSTGRRRGSWRVGATDFFTAGRGKRADFAHRAAARRAVVDRDPDVAPPQGQDKPARLTKSERERAEERGWQGVKTGCS